MSISLSQYAEENEAAREVLASGTSSIAEAARKVTELGFPTSESSVRRYRNSHALTMSNLASPYPRGKGASADWQPRLDLGATDGSFTTVPRVPTGAVPDDTELLALMDLDPEVWTVASGSIRVSRWQVAQKDEEPRWLEAYRGDVRLRSGRTGLSESDLEAILARYPTPQPSAPAANSILLAVLADCQSGKPDGGGTERMVQTYRRCIDGVAQRIRDTSENKVKLLVLADVGDPVEGYVSQGGRNVILDATLTEQLRIMRRLWLHAIGVLAPLCDRMLCPVVPDNHSQTTRQFNAKPSDNFALEIASTVSDALQMNDAYHHVEFVWPGESEISLAVNVGSKSAPLNVGFTHGHMTSNPGGVVRWWEGQTLGSQPVGNAHILVSGHYHHLRVEQCGAGRTWVQAPALESGSDWYRHRRGAQTPSGMLSMWLEPGLAIPWSDLRIHS